MCLQKLAEIKGLSDAKVEKLLDAARKLCSSYGWQTAKTMEIQVSLLYFTTAWPVCALQQVYQFSEVETYAFQGMHHATMQKMLSALYLPYLQAMSRSFKGSHISQRCSMRLECVCVCGTRGRRRL